MTLLVGGGAAKSTGVGVYRDQVGKWWELMALAARGAHKYFVATQGCTCGDSDRRWSGFW